MNPNFANMEGGGQAQAPPQGTIPALNNPHLQALIFSKLQETHQPQAWQPTPLVPERVNSVKILATQLGLIREMPVQHLVRAALETEVNTFRTASSREQYDMALRQKNMELQQMRIRKGQSTEQSINAPGRPMGQMGFQGQMQPGMAGQNPNLQGFPPQAQRPMQQGQVPMSSAQQAMNMAVGNPMMPTAQAAAAAAAQQQRQQQQQQQQRQQQQQHLQQQQHHQPQPQQTPQQHHQQQPPQPQQAQQPNSQNMQQFSQQHLQRQRRLVANERLTQQEALQVILLAAKFSTNTSDADREKFRIKFANMPPEKRAIAEQAGLEPLDFVFEQQALNAFRNRKNGNQWNSQQRQQQQQNTAGMNQAGLSGPGGPYAGGQQGQRGPQQPGPQPPQMTPGGIGGQRMQPSPANSQFMNTPNPAMGQSGPSPQPAPAAGGVGVGGQRNPMQQQMSDALGGAGMNGNFDRYNIDNIGLQQANAFSAAESGQLVVPASSSAAMQGMGGQQPGAQQLQQRLAAQQAQQDRIRQFQAQQQAQNAQNVPRNAQGQPMGNPLGHDQNQAGSGLQTLNQPMTASSPQGRGSSQPRADAGQLGPGNGAQFVDPRFAQQPQSMPQNRAGQQQPNMMGQRFPQGNSGHQQGMGPGQGAAPTVIPEAFKQRFPNLPDERLRKYIESLRNASQAELGAANMGRPGMQGVNPANNQAGADVPQNQPQPQSQGMPQASGQAPQKRLGSNGISPVNLNPDQTQLMDQIDFPRNILKFHNNNHPPVPDQIKTWTDAKMWIESNSHPELPDPQQMRGLQSMHYQIMLRQRQQQRGQQGQIQAQAQGQGQGQQGQQPGQQGGMKMQQELLRQQQPPQTPQQLQQQQQQQMNMANAARPPNATVNRFSNGQMPAGQRMGQPGAMPQSLHPVTSQDVQYARAKYGEQLKNATDEQVGRMIMTERRTAQIRAAGGNPAQMKRAGQGMGPNQNQNQNQGQNQAFAQAQSRMPQQPGLPAAQQQQNFVNSNNNQAMPQNSQQQVQQQAASTPSQPPAKKTAKQNQSSKGPQKQEQSPTQTKGGNKQQSKAGANKANVQANQQAKTAKSEPSNQAPGAVPQQANQPMARNITELSQLTPEQLHQLTPDQRKQLEAHLKAQQTQSGIQRPGAPNQVGHLQGGQQSVAQQVANQQQQQEVRIRQLHAEAFNKNVRHRHLLVDMDQNTRAEMTKMLNDRSVKGTLPKLMSSLLAYFKATNDEPRVRELLRVKVVLDQQYSEGLVPKGEYSMDLSELHEMLQSLSMHTNQVMAFFTQHRARMQGASPQAQQQLQTQGRQNQQVEGQTETENNTQQLSAANPQQQEQLAKQQKAMEKAQSRRHSHQPPAAPTSDKPPFPLGASSPQGVPQAYGPTTLTADKLSLPPQRKRKAPAPGAAQGQQGTPESTASPQATRSDEPDAKRQKMGAQEPILAHKCSEVACPFHLKGFATAEELEKHKNAEHEVKIEDPLQYALEWVAIGLGLEKDGSVKKEEVKNNSHPAQAASRASSIKPTTSTTGASPAPSSKAKALQPSGLKNVTTPSAGGEQVNKTKSANATTGTTGQLPTPPSAGDATEASKDEVIRERALSCFRGLSNEMRGYALFQDTPPTPEETPPPSKPLALSAAKDGAETSPKTDPDGFLDVFADWEDAEAMDIEPFEKDPTLAGTIEGQGIDMRWFMGSPDPAF